jgi:UDP-glucose 4-epimerase
MKVFVTGGAGYIGSVTVKMLIDGGRDVVVFDNFERGHREALDPRAELIVGDLRDKEAIAAAMSRSKPDVVMHFAAYALVGESMEHPERYFGNNLGGGINLAEAMIKADVTRIVFSSTCATYGQPDSDLIAEDTPQRPTNPYGESKLMFEKILCWYKHIYGIEPVFLRYFNAAGASDRLGEDHDPETHLIPNVLKVALGQSEGVKIFGNDYDTPDGTCVRDYIHVWDLARAHVMALDKPEGLAVNLGTGRGYSVMQVLETARAVSGRNIAASVFPRRPGDPARLVADCSMAEKALGWKPERSSLEEIVRTAWAWHSAHPEGYGK